MASFSRVSSLTLFTLMVAESVACGPSKASAEAYLESEGFSNVVLTPSGKSFEFTATKAADLCTGSVVVSKGFGTSSQSFESSCDLDTRACKPGAPAECVRLADTLFAKDALSSKMKAGDLYRTACADDNGHACGRVARFDRTNKEFDKLRANAKKGCDLGDGESCEVLGFAAMNAEGAPKDEALGVDMFKKACAKSISTACRNLAGILLDHEPPDNAAAMPVAEQVCKANIEDGCTLYGMVLFRTKDYAHALPLVTTACEESKMTTRAGACNLAGAIFFDGLGTKKDLTKGADYFGKACDADDIDGCENAARAYKSGLGVARDKDKSVALLAKACKLGAAKDCTP